MADTNQDQKACPDLAYNFIVDNYTRMAHSLKDGSHARDSTVPGAQLLSINMMPTMLCPGAYHG